MKQFEFYEKMAAAAAREWNDDPLNTDERRELVTAWLEFYADMESVLMDFPHNADIDTQFQFIMEDYD